MYLCRILLALLPTTATVLHFTTSPFSQWVPAISLSHDLVSVGDASVNWPFCIEPEAESQLVRPLHPGLCWELISLLLLDPSNAALPP